MTREIQLKALAELDGWELVHFKHDPSEPFFADGDVWKDASGRFVRGSPPAYLDSLDAAQALFKKLTRNQKLTACGLVLFWQQALGECALDLTPAMWCMAILKATDRWEDGE
jgi:hypothetical protein